MACSSTIRGRRSPVTGDLWGSSLFLLLLRTTHPLLREFASVPGLLKALDETQDVC